MAFLPFERPIFSHISRVLSLCNIKTVGLTPCKVFSFLWSIKDAIGLKTPGIYNIPWGYGRVYIGYTRHSIKTRTEHCWYFLLYHVDKFDMAENSMDSSHHIQFNDTSFLAKKHGYM
jgi:hypothetical protein